MSVLMMATGVNALLFAQLMANLSPLSASFGERRPLVLGIGALAFGIGLVVNCFTVRQEPVPRGRIGRSERIVLNVAAGALVGFFSFAAAVYLMQERLLFSPRPVSSSRLDRLAREYPRAEALEIVAPDGAVLRGWLVPPSGSSPGAEGVARAVGGRAADDGVPSEGQGWTTSGMPLVLVFAGQGGEASSYVDLSRRLPEMAWAFVNYRGYGASDGSPSETALYGDAVAVYDALTGRPDIDARRVFALGGSLGTGVATHLAAQRPVAGVVLFSPYDRIGGGVAQDMLPWVPTGWLFRHRFDARRDAPLARAPALAVVGGADRVIRPERSRRLMAEWGGGHRLVVIPDGDHFSIYEDDGAWRVVQGFVRGLANPDQ